MKFATSAVFAAVACAAAAFAAPASKTFDPQVEYPTKGTSWYPGDKQFVVWSTRNAPRTLANYNVTAIFLAKNGNLYGNPLAKNFDIRRGNQRITVPSNLPAGSDYSIVLFHQSRVFGKVFRIRPARATTAASTSASTTTSSSASSRPTSSTSTSTSTSRPTSSASTTSSSSSNTFVTFVTTEDAPVTSTVVIVPTTDNGLSQSSSSTTAVSSSSSGSASTTSASSSVTVPVSTTEPVPTSTTL